MMPQRFLVLCVCFTIQLLVPRVLSWVSYASSCSRKGSRNSLCMKWRFEKGNGPMKDLGGIGGQGEYYYIPSKKPQLIAPKEVLGKEMSIPIYPRNQVLPVMGEDYIGVYEMRYRQLINDVGDSGVFGHVYYSQENAKLAMVGTIAKLKKIERLDDGGIYVSMIGVGRFYLRDIKAEKPYLRARVQIFNDYFENEVLMESLEVKLLSELRYSVKLMKLLYPQNNYTINEIVLKNRPFLQSSEKRTIKLPGEDTDLARRSKFSFASMDMLKTDPVTKLLFLQEPMLEKRYANMIKVLEESVAFLEGELKKRGVVTDETIKKLKQELLEDMADLEMTPKASWIPENFSNGDWLLGPTVMD